MAQDAEEAAPELQQINPNPVQMSYLDLVNDCDTFPYPETDPELYAQYMSTYFSFYIMPCTDPLGYLLPSVALTLKGIEGWQVDETNRQLTLDLPKGRKNSTLFTVGDDDAPPAADGDAAPQLTEEQRRSAAIAHTVTAMRETGHFQVLKKWRDELYPIYWRPSQAPPAVLKSRPEASGIKAEVLASMERSASALFGIVTYGCHLTAYVRRGPLAPSSTASSVQTSLHDDLAIWVPRRAYSKGTYPGMLDQTVAGGLPTGETAMSCLVREASEEASLPEELVRRKARAVGSVSYFHVRDQRAGGETRLMQPELQYCYDLDLTGETLEDGQEVVPKPNDDEVEGFELLGMEEVKAALAGGEFKPNCALVLVDFMIRHGVITPENEPDYNEIMVRLHRKLEFPIP